MGSKKPIIQKCKVLRPFYLNGEVQKKKSVIELEEPFAIEMKASLKVAFVGSGKEDANEESKEESKK